MVFQFEFKFGVIQSISAYKVLQIIELNIHYLKLTFKDTNMYHDYLNIYIY